MYQPMTVDQIRESIMAATDGAEVDQRTIVDHVRAGSTPKPDPMRIRYQIGELVAAGRLRCTRRATGRRSALYASGAAPKVDAGTDAPDFLPGYPSGGQQIGPAWAAMWRELADGDWHESYELAGTGAEAGELLPKTARNLLYGAVKAGLIEPDVRLNERRRWVAWYRRCA